MVERATEGGYLGDISPETDLVRRLEDLPSPRGLPFVGNFHQPLILRSFIDDRKWGSKA